jgi:hypothetical protein
MARKNNLPPNGPGRGRPKGALNKATRDIKDIARGLLSNEEYQRNLVKRLTRGTAGPVESLLYQYAFGKPKDTVELSGPNGGPLQAIEWRIVDPTKRDEPA